jgi:hypothetical protein
MFLVVQFENKIIWAKVFKIREHILGLLVGFTGSNLTMAETI